MDTRRMIKISKIAACVGLLFLLCGGMDIMGKTIAIRGGEIHTMEGEIWRSGTILIQDGKIVAIGEDVPVPEDAEIIEAGGSILYPGFFASSGLFTPEELKNFESFTPDASAADRFDFHGDYAQLLRGGVTSGFVAMPANRIISGKGMIVKLGSGSKMSLILKKEAALNINLGRDAVLPPMTDIFPAPVSVENPLVPSIKQFPSSNLGAFGLMNELFRPVPYSGDLARYFQNAANSLKKSQTRGLSLIVRCQGDADIHQAILFSRSVKMPLIIQGTPEAYKWADSLKKHNIPVIAEADLRPNRYGLSEDLKNNRDWQNRMINIPTLIRRGVLVSITANEEKGLPDLFWITQYFQRFGINSDELIKTITINPAKIFGLDDRVGSLTKGKDADILFFKKEAGVPLPALEKVMSQGQIIYEEK
ncbi:MAG: amidohydrolase family protein [Candidatus Aminicenantes bacterium]|nr:MAG: amidohydrolase family protein [Candidatus Aminicenantes bacterium]